MYKVDCQFWFLRITNLLVSEKVRQMLIILCLKPIQVAKKIFGINKRNREGFEYLNSILRPKMSIVLLQKSCYPLTYLFQIADNIWQKEKRGRMYVFSPVKILIGYISLCHSFQCITTVFLNRRDASRYRDLETSLPRVEIF